VSTKLSSVGLVAMFIFMASSMFLLLPFILKRGSFDLFPGMSWTLPVFSVGWMVSGTVLLALLPSLNRMREYEELLRKKKLLERYAVAADARLLDAVEVKLCDKELGEFLVVLNVLGVPHYDFLKPNVIKGILSNNVERTVECIQAFESDHPFITILRKKLE
ncbi:MAG TPA: hypothetical protein DIT25_04275, partial [Candidatus Moranbacteria bacterium]|nr:hypothetical protein [Candidatus Moranbacteria bacterium]